MLITILVPAPCLKCDGANRATRRQCSACKGRGRVSIPAKVDRSGLIELIKAGLTADDDNA